MSKENNALENENVFEDDYRIVKKVIKDIKVSSNYAKRVAEVIWKRSNNQDTVIDIRVFNTDKNEYYKGVSLSIEEAKELMETLTEYFKE